MDYYKKLKLLKLPKYRREFFSLCKMIFIMDGLFQTSS